ncbi:hypothetical protein ERO13_D12G035550v2 [Gossypium hirsutum]|uniref:Exocyst subunit Exo70 family protein n=2 Tax=Gossypium TaxID=3633 RepID=A0A1U8MRG9_GOSHI|nr:exocyst complex component EXO70E2-like [Gossypium hirsutum]KAG4114270.1 hypothetical protein ERO13_D12G035550v2 [Gossypium hirsutum]
MDGCRPGVPTYKGDLHVVAAAHHIVKALGATKNLSDDLRKILIDLDSHLSMITLNIDSKGGRGLVDVKERLDQAERKIMRWETDPMMIWDSGPKEASDYLETVDETGKLVDGLRGLSVHENQKQKEILHRAMNILQMAMSRLEEELIHILVQHGQQFEPKNMYSRSIRKDIVYDESFVSVEDEPTKETSSRNCSNDESGECIVDLVHADVIPDIKSIAKVMFTSNYGPEFCDQVLGGFGSVSSYCFLEISKATILCLLNFGEAVAMGPHRPEKLLRLLDMYETLAGLLRDIDTLFSEEAGSFIQLQFHELYDHVAVCCKNIV